MESLLTNYLEFLKGNYGKEEIKTEILDFKNNNGNAQEFEQLVITATKGVYKKNIVMQDFWKYYNDYILNTKGKTAYGTGHMKDFRKRF